MLSLRKMSPLAAISPVTVPLKEPGAGELQLNRPLIEGDAELLPTTPILSRDAMLPETAALLTARGFPVLELMRPEPAPATPARVYQMDRPSPAARQAAYRAQSPGFAELSQDYSGRIMEPVPETAPVDEPQDLPLGAARGQVHENYIIAQTADGMVIVDQHAAHERLVYEKLKAQMAENGVAAQALLIPEIVELTDGDCARLMAVAEDLSRFGLTIESFGGGAIAVRETPAILGEVDARAMILDILDELADQGESQMVRARIEAILSRVACHGSVRSGRRMRAEEMNALLREMEATPHSGQCNHGRPTYVELKLSDIERLFGRS